MIDKIINLLNKSHDSTLSNMPPTILYNEGWMLRLVLDWFKNNPGVTHKLAIPADCNWYSEALLPSPFLRGPKDKNKRFAEGYTHADGVAGKFDIGILNKGELSLKPECDFLYITEAKMFSSLSAGTKNAGYYNQAARNIACIADLSVRANLVNCSFRKLAFYVLLPESHSDMNNIKTIISKQHITATILRRINDFENYDNEHGSISWLRTNTADFVSKKIETDVITWEEIVKFINDPSLEVFYNRCLNFNQKYKNA